MNMNAVIFKGAFILFSLFWVYGTYKRWSWIIKPKYLSIDRVIRDAFGEKFFIWMNYLIPIILILLMLFVF
jgi:hypothetical protein